MKYIKVIGIVILIIIVLAFGLYLLPVNPSHDYSLFPAQANKFRRIQLEKIDKDSLLENFGFRKIIPQNIEVQALLALSKYPKLRNLSIEFVYVQKGAPMESSFDISSLLGPRENRRYKILLQNSDEDFLKPIHIRNLNKDAQVGILTHELAHTVFYSNLNIWQIASWGLKYLIDLEFRSIHEKSTDEVAIKVGHGWQLYEFTNFAWTEAFGQDMSDSYIANFYLSPQEIKDKISDYSK